MRRLVILAVVLVSMLWSVEASARPRPARKAVKAAVTAAARPLGRVAKVVKIILPPYLAR